MTDTVIHRLKRDRAEKKLHELLARADYVEFLRLIWAVNALQNGKAVAASRLIEFPPEAANTDISSGHAIHEWELETIGNELLITAKQPLRPGLSRITDCRKFGTMAAAVNLLRGLRMVTRAFVSRLRVFFWKFTASPNARSLGSAAFSMSLVFVVTPIFMPKGVAGSSTVTGMDLASMN